MAEADITKVLALYGINTTGDFWRRYHTDALVYSLVNIVSGQHRAMQETLAEVLSGSDSDGGDHVG